MLGELTDDDRFPANKRRSAGRGARCVIERRTSQPRAEPAGVEVWTASSTRTIRASGDFVRAALAMDVAVLKFCGALCRRGPPTITEIH